MISRVIEPPNGSGEIQKAGQHICNVRYQIQQRELPSSGQIEITGEVTVDQSERMSISVLNTMGSGEVLTLYLSDGRHIDVSISRGDPMSGTYRIVIAPGFSGFVSK